MIRGQKSEVRKLTHNNTIKMKTLNLPERRTPRKKPQDAMGIIIPKRDELLIYPADCDDMHCVQVRLIEVPRRGFRYEITIDEDSPEQVLRWLEWARMKINELPRKGGFKAVAAYLGDTVKGMTV